MSRDISSLVNEVALEELKRRLNPTLRDPFALIESGALMIKTKAGRLLPLTPATMKPGQLRAYEHIKKTYQAGKPVRVRWLKYRQGGFSTLAELITFAVTLCNDYYAALCLSNQRETAQWIFDMALLFQEQMEAGGAAWLERLCDGVSGFAHHLHSVARLR